MARPISPDAGLSGPPPGLPPGKPPTPLASSSGAGPPHPRAPRPGRRRPAAPLPASLPKTTRASTSTHFFLHPAAVHLSSRHPPPHIARPARAPAHPRPTRQLPNKSTSWRIGEPESWRAHRTLPHFCYRTRYTASPPARHSPAHPSASPLPALGLSPPRRLPAPNGRGAPAHACRAPSAFAGPVSVHPHHQPVPTASSSPRPCRLTPRPLSSSALTALPRGKPPTPHPYPEPLLPPAPRRPVLSRAPALAGLSGQPTPRPCPRSPPARREPRSCRSRLNPPT